MKGKISFYAKNNHICFKFELDRNVTVITGDSGTGKTKLINMVRAYSEEGKSSGVTLRCSCHCYVLEGKNWEMQLGNISKSVVFIDESSKFVSSKDFAEAIMKTDNYYVLVTREPLPQIAYSIYSIKRIIKNGRNPKVEKVYNNVGIKDITKIKYDVIIVEDAKSGFQFFTKVSESLNTICISAEGKSNILNKLSSQNATKILVIADAATFGSEIYELIYYIEKNKNNVTVDLFLPESFEWLILKSQIFASCENVQEILKNPVDYIESRNFFSWERFFLQLLVDESKSEVKLKYPMSKKSLPSGYLTEENMNSILNAMGKK